MLIFYFRDLNLFKMIKIYESQDSQEILKFFMDYGLIRSPLSPPLCQHCQEPLVWRSRDVSNEYTWRCKSCSSPISILIDSYFYKIKISLATFVKLVFHWAIQTKICDIVDVVGLYKL